MSRNTVVSTVRMSKKILLDKRYGDPLFIYSIFVEMTFLLVIFL